MPRQLHLGCYSTVCVLVANGAGGERAFQNWRGRESMTFLSCRSCTGYVLVTLALFLLYPTACSVVYPQMPYVMDLHLFLSRPVQFNADDRLHYTIATMAPTDVHCGCFPRRVLDAELESMRTILASDELQALHKSATNAFKLYVKVRH